MRGAIVTAAALIGLQVLLSTPLANLAGAAALPAQWARNWMDPAVPLIPARPRPGPARTQAGIGAAAPLDTRTPPAPAAGRPLARA